METIKRQTSAVYSWMVVGQSVCAGFSYGLYAVRQLCLWHEQRRCSCRMQLVALYKCYVSLSLLIYRSRRDERLSWLTHSGQFSDGRSDHLLDQV